MKQQKLIKTHSISEFISRNQERKNVRWKLSEGELEFYYDGEWYAEEFFDAFFPLYTYVKYNPKGDLIGTNYLL